MLLVSMSTICLTHERHYQHLLERSCRENVEYRASTIIHRVTLVSLSEPSFFMLYLGHAVGGATGGQSEARVD